MKGCNWKSVFAGCLCAYELINQLRFLCLSLMIYTVGAWLYHLPFSCFSRSSNKIYLHANTHIFTWHWWAMQKLRKDVLGKVKDRLTLPHIASCKRLSLLTHCPLMSLCFLVYSVLSFSLCVSNSLSSFLHRAASNHNFLGILPLTSNSI